MSGVWPKGLTWAPHGLLGPTVFGLRDFEQFKGTRVKVVEGCGKDGHGMVREVIYWLDEKGRLIARYDPTDVIDTARAAWEHHEPEEGL